jgi:hypothetical protein
MMVRKGEPCARLEGHGGSHGTETSLQHGRERNAVLLRDPVVREAGRERGRKWRAEHPGYHKAYLQDYYANPSNYEAKLENHRNYYHGLSGPEYSKRLLDARRRKALVRMRARHETGEVLSG